MSESKNETLKRKLDTNFTILAKRPKTEDLDDELRGWFDYYIDCGYSAETALDTVIAQSFVVDKPHVPIFIADPKKSGRELTKIREDFAIARNYKEMESLITNHWVLMKEDPSLTAKAVRRYSIIKCRHPDELPWAEFGGELSNVVSDTFVKGLRSKMDEFIEQATASAREMNKDTSVADEKSDQIIEPHLEAKIGENTSESTSYVSCTAICDFLWGLAKMNTRCLPIYLQLLKCLNHPSLRDGRFASVPLAEAIWALGRGVDMSIEFLTNEKGQVHKVDDLLGDEERSALDFLCEQMAYKVDLGQLTAGNLVSLMHGISRLGHKHYRLLKEIAEELVRKHKDFSEKDFSEIAKYFIRFGMNLRNEIENIKNPLKQVNDWEYPEPPPKPQPIERIL